MGAPKHALVLQDGSTLLEWVARALSRCVATVVVAGLKEETIPDRPGPHLRRIPDLHPGLGPLAGIHAALRQTTTAGCLFAACDQPFLRGETLGSLLDGRPERPRCLVAEATGRFLPLPVYLPGLCLPQVEDELLRGGRSIRGLLAALEPERIAVPPRFERSLRSVNTPGEWSQCRAELGAAPG